MFKIRTLLVALLAGQAAQGAAQSPLEEIQVTASRIQSELIAPARQTTVLERGEAQLRMKAGGTLAELLSASVPGLAPASQTPSEFALNLRGRGFLTLIDGVPMAPSRNVNRNLSNLHPYQIERVEVLRGGNAVYGSGASGGVVAITTLQPTAAHEQSSYFEGSSSLTSPGGDSFGYQASQSFTGSFETFDYAFSLTKGESGANFDADGERIAPEVSQGDLFEAESLGLLAKLGRNYGAGQRLQLSLNAFDMEQDTDHASDTSVLEEPLRSVDARTVPGLVLDKQNEFENSLANLEYFNEAVMGGSMHAQLYYRDHETRFYPFDARALATWRHLVQTYLRSESLGGRLTVNTPVGLFGSGDSEVLWGLDFNDEESQAPVTTYDGTVFDQSGGLIFLDTGDKVHMPPIDTASMAAFVQLRTQLSERWSWDLGARFETVEVGFDDFVPLAQTLEPQPAVIAGGELDYDEWMFNAALVFSPVDGQEFYAAFNQGFDQPDIGLQVRNARPGFDIRGSNLQAIITDNYEVGWRGAWDRLSASLALFQSRSDLGGVSTVDFGLTLSRTEERIRGIEATLDYAFDQRWSGGFSFSWVDGEEKPSPTGGFRDMNGFRSPPAQWKGYLAFTARSGWDNRLQLYYVGEEDYRLGGAESFGRRTVDSYWTADLLSRYAFGSSTVQVGVENLFNNDYKTLYGQLLRSNSNQSHIPARGATLRLSYSYDW